LDPAIKQCVGGSGVESAQGLRLPDWLTLWASGLRNAFELHEADIGNATKIEDTGPARGMVDSNGLAHQGGMKGRNERRTLATCGDVSTPKVKGHRYTGSLSQLRRGKELKAKALARAMPHGLPMDPQRGDLAGGQACLSEEVVDQVGHRIGERQACLGCHLEGVGQPRRQQR
jgi:hypothetical protein